DRNHPAARRRNRRPRSPILPAHGFSLSRPRHSLSDRARRRAEAQGNFLHPRRRLSAGEMTHGPNALIDENLPVVVIATRDESDPASMTRYEKTVSNLQEVKARDGIVISVVTEGDHLARDTSDRVIEIPAAPDLIAPILEIVPLQMLAYHIAVRRGCDV